MVNDVWTDSKLRALVVATLDRDPDATFEQVHAHLRSAEGRALDNSETERLRGAYEMEIANPTGTHRIGVAEAAQIAADQPFALRRSEIIGFVIGLIPFVPFFQLQTTTPDTVQKGTGAVIRGGVYDLVAMLAGFVVVVIGIAAARQAADNISRRLMHFAVAGLVLLLGLYQSLLGLGILHQIGVFKAG